jgi:hypothetical protein
MCPCVLSFLFALASVCCACRNDTYRFSIVDLKLIWKKNGKMNLPDLSLPYFSAELANAHAILFFVYPISDLTMENANAMLHIQTYVYTHTNRLQENCFFERDTMRRHEREKSKWNSK